MDLIFGLLIAFQIKHFVADYPLQNEYMLGKFKKEGWIKPLAAHVAVHAGFTFFVVAVASSNALLALGLAALDAILHFTMDRIKASPKLLGRFKSMTKDDFDFHKTEVDLLDSALKRKSLDIEIYNRRKNKMVARFNTVKHSNKWFWLSLGIDQMVHFLTHYLIIFLTLYLK